MKLLLIVFLAVHGLVVPSTNANNDDVLNLLQRVLDSANTPEDTIQQEPSDGPLKCTKCQNIVGSNRGNKYCVSEMPEVVETCAEGVTKCYIRVRNRVDLEAKRINTMEVIRGCQPDEVVCDEAIAIKGGFERYTQCCDQNECNVDDVVAFPEE